MVALYSEEKGREGKGREGKGREGKGREGKGREGKGREGKGREGKGREGKSLDASRFSYKLNLAPCCAFVNATNKLLSCTHHIKRLL